MTKKKDLTLKNITDWLDNFLEENNINSEETFRVGNAIGTFGEVINHISNGTEHEKNAIQATLLKLNGNKEIIKAFLRKLYRNLLENFKAVGQITAKLEKVASQIRAISGTPVNRRYVVRKVESYSERTNSRGPRHGWKYQITRDDGKVFHLLPGDYAAWKKEKMAQGAEVVLRNRS